MVRTGLKSLFKLRKEKRKTYKINSWSILFLMAFQKGKNRGVFFFFACMSETWHSFILIFLSCSPFHLYRRNVIPLLMTFLWGLFSVMQSWRGWHDLILFTVLLPFLPSHIWLINCNDLFRAVIFAFIFFYSFFFWSPSRLKSKLKPCQEVTGYVEDRAVVPAQGHSSHPVNKNLEWDMCC